MSLNVLVVGAGIGGSAFASLLLRSNISCSVRVVERSSHIRATGAQIDVKSQAVPVLEKMGLLDELKARTVKETGLEIVDVNDRILASYGVTSANSRGFNLTSEFEIMRGDLVDILYRDSVAKGELAKNRNAFKSQLSYEFGKTVVGLTQTTSSAEVTFSDGQKGSFDLVVAADGQSSYTRELAFGSKVNTEAFRSLDVHAAYFSIPRTAAEGGLARGFFTQDRFLLTRNSNRQVTGTYVFARRHQEQLKASYRETILDQKSIWSNVLHGVEWQEARLLSGLKTCEDFYAHEQAQIKMQKLHQGRVVLLGDAGYGPSPFTGLGTTLALSGAYVLAGELTRRSCNVLIALSTYEAKMRPLIDDCQELPPGILKWMFPSSKIGAWILRKCIWAVSAFKIDEIISSWMANDKTKSGQGWKAPTYPGLNLNLP